MGAAIQIRLRHARYGNASKEYHIIIPASVRLQAIGVPRSEHRFGSTTHPTLSPAMLTSSRVLHRSIHPAGVIERALGIVNVSLGEGEK